MKPSEPPGFSYEPMSLSPGPIHTDKSLDLDVSITNPRMPIHETIQENEEESKVVHPQKNQMDNAFASIESTNNAQIENLPAVIKTPM